MKRKVHLCRSTREPADLELFPDPRKVFAEWTEEIAARIIPVALFDLSLEDRDASGPACFLYYDDVQVSFLSWKTEGGLITELEGDWREIAPLYDPPDLEAMAKRPGLNLRLESYEIDIGVPSEYEDWADVFAEKMDALDAWDLYCLRIGGGFPIYVQGDTPLDDPGFVAQLPAGAHDLAPMDFYLFEDGKGNFQQEMQMT